MMKTGLLYTMATGITVLIFALTFLVLWFLTRLDALDMLIISGAVSSYSGLLMFTKIEENKK